MASIPAPLAQADREVVEQACLSRHRGKERIGRQHIGLRRSLRGFCLLLRDAQGHTGMLTGLQRSGHRRAHGVTKCTWLDITE